MENKDIKWGSWINNLLETSEKNSSPEIISIIEQCGRGCANRKGALEGIKQLREQAKECNSTADYVEFFRNKLHINASETPDGIILTLGKPHCTCPMAPEVNNGMLCHCTRGHEVAVWSEFFGHSVNVEILESHLRGGKDCVIKIIL